MSVDLESRTRAALRQFDSNMSGIFDRASFYDQDLYSQAAYPQLTRAQMCFKYTLFAANLLFLIFACVLIAVGSYATTNSIGALSGQTLPIGITVLGVFILVLAVVGGVAAYKEIRALLIVYFIVLMILTIILFFVGIAVYVERDNLDTYIDQGWQVATPDLKQSLQVLFSCCGCCTDNFVPFNQTNYVCDEFTVSPQKLACRPVFDSYLHSYYVTAGGCAIAFAVIMIAGLFLVCFLMQGIKKKRAEQDLAKLRASNNTEDADLHLTSAQRTQPTGHDELDDEDEEEEEEEEEEDEDDAGQ